MEDATPQEAAENNKLKISDPEAFRLKMQAAGDKVLLVEAEMKEKGYAPNSITGKEYKAICFGRLILCLLLNVFIRLSVFGHHVGS